MPYTIGEVAIRIGLSVHTLRYYEKEGLLQNVKRTEGKIRSFDDYDLECLKVIECLKKTGMPLKDIKAFLDLCEMGNETLTERLELFKERKLAVEAQIAELQQTLDIIKYKNWYYETACKAHSEAAVHTMPLDEVPEEFKAAFKRLHDNS